MRFMLSVLAAMAVASLACPMFVEFFPDPTEVSDVDGEFVEIRLDDFRADSIFVGMDLKAPLGLPFPRSANRLLLVHDSTQCPKRDSLACGGLGSYALPNSRESGWVLRSGSCSDSVELPSPKAGKSLQRIGETGEWTPAVPTPGVANPDYELGIRDCGIRLLRAEWRDGVGWSLRGMLSGCDSAQAGLEYLDMASAGNWKRREVSLSGTFDLEIPGKGAAWVRMALPEDAAPGNDSLDRILVPDGRSPASITEIHHCPSEPMPEWVEIYNASRYALPLSRLHLCGRGGSLGRAADSLQPYGSMLVTKDSAALRESLGFDDVRIAQVSMGYLNNVAGNVSLCLDSVVIDSVAWTKNTVSCPAGFNPVYGRAENTPGFQRPGDASLEEPFSYKLSSRVVSRRGPPLRVSVVSESEVCLRLLDSAGHGVWSTHVGAMSSSWMEVPAMEHCGLGVCYVSLSVGTFEKVVGIVVRP